MGVCRKEQTIRGQEERVEAAAATGGGEFVFSLRRQVGWGGEDETELRRASDRDALR